MFVEEGLIELLLGHTLDKQLLHERSERAFPLVTGHLSLDYVAAVSADP